MKTKARSAPPPASSWKEVPELINGRPAEYETVAYGITRSLSGNELWVDFGNELGELSMARLTFRDQKAASDAYCKGIRLAMKVVEHPEHKLENAQAHPTAAGGTGGAQKGL